MVVLRSLLSRTASSTEEPSKQGYGPASFKSDTDNGQGTRQVHRKTAGLSVAGANDLHFSLAMDPLTNNQMVVVWSWMVIFLPNFVKK
jgi:hypothetical protein